MRLRRRGWTSPTRRSRGTSTLRLSFDYFGSKSFLHGWNGDVASVEEFIDQQAEDYAAEADWERNEFGTTDWDDV
jgi:hypothetical protein